MDEEQIVRLYADMVYKIAFRYTRNATDADDVFSEVFLAYFRKERTFESEEHRKSWLIRVTINCAKDQLSRRTDWAELDPELDGAAVSIQEDAAREDILDLRRAVMELKPEYREVICLYYIEGLPVRRVAEILGRNENTVKAQLARGRKALRQALECR